MWRYQRPGFEALLLAELQRQQRCRQFCDTVLRAEGVSVPAHSCILSALSPKLSCALSTSPAPPSGQSHLLDFQAFGACTLLRLVGLLYSGEMVGEGEAERQEVISAAARLGIQGLVEVGKKDDRKEREVENVVQQSRRRAGPSSAEENRLMEGVSQRDVGVQTDPLQSSEAQTERNMGGEREKRGGEALTMRLRERMKPTMCEKDSGTQACELKGSETDTGDSKGGCSTGPICSTVDSGPVFSSASHVDDVIPILGTEASSTVVPVPLSVPLPPNVPYIPPSHLLYSRPSENNTPNNPHTTVFMPSGESAPIYFLPPSLSSRIPLSISSVTMSASGREHVNEGHQPFTSDPPQTWGMGLPGGLGPGGEGETEGFERFEGNIAGFISYFLDPAQPQEENLRGRRGQRRRAGGSKRGGTERRARRPRGGGGGAKGAVKKKGSEIEQAVMEVSQGTRLWRCGVQACRTGRGGGMVGSKLYLKRRELMQPIKIRLKRRGRSEEWEIIGVEEERGGASQRGRRIGRGQQNAGQQLVPDGFPVFKRQKGLVKPLPFPALPKQLYQSLTYETSSPSKRLTLSPSPPPSPAPYLAPALALLHTAPLPPLDPPPQEDSAEQFDRMLEDIMMGLDFACGGRQDTGLGVAVGAPSAMDTVTEVTGAGDRSGSAKSSSEVGLQQQHAEGELSDILDHFLRSFEQQVAASNPVAEGQVDRARRTASLSEPYTALSNYSGAQMVTSTDEHRTLSTQVREEQSYAHTDHTHTSNTGQSNTHMAQVYMPQPEPSYTHTAHTHTSNTGQSNTHTAHVEQCSKVTHPAHTHLPLSHISPLPHSTPTNSVQPTITLPSNSLPPSTGKEGRVMTRRRLRGEINTQPIVRPKKRHGERNMDRTRPRLLIKKPHGERNMDRTRPRLLIKKRHGERNMDRTRPRLLIKKRNGERNMDRIRPRLLIKKRRIKKGYSMDKRNLKSVPLPGVDDVLPGVSFHTGEVLCQPKDAARETPTPCKLPNQVADALPGGCVQTNKMPCQPAVYVVRMEKTVLPGAESLTGKCLPPVNGPIMSPEKIKVQTKAWPAAESDTTQKSTPLPNPPISPIRTPEKLRGQSSQPIRQSKEDVRRVSRAVAIVKRGRGRPPEKWRKVIGVCAKVTSTPVPPGQNHLPAEQPSRGGEQPSFPAEQTSLPAVQTSREGETKKRGRRRRGGGKKPQLGWEEGSEPARTIEKRRRVEESEEERTTKRACPAAELVPPVQTLSETHPPISVPEAPACGEQVHPEDREGSGKKVTTEEDNVDVTQGTTSSAFQMIREVLQTQCRVKEGEGEREGEETGWSKFKPQKTDQTEERETRMDKIDVEDIRAIEEDSDESIDVVGDGEEWMTDRAVKQTELHNPPIQIEEWKVPVLSGIVKPPVSHHSHSIREVDIEGSTGSWEGEKEEEVDVLGGCSPSPVPPVMLPGSWGEGLSSEEDEIDVIGGELDHTPFIGYLSSLL